MVQMPSERALLDAWEIGLEQGPVERGLTLLAVASPGDDPGALAALSIGERDRRLLALREAALGPRMTGLVGCPRCGEQLELELTTRDLRIAPPRDAALTLRGDDHELQLRLPDSRDLLAVAALDASAAPAALLERCLVLARVGGEPASADRLSPDLVAEAGRRLADADPQTDVRFALACPACGCDWSAPFDIVAFLWAEIETWANRLLGDVHVLASAYGWSEPDVLAVSPARRRSYLQMVCA
ncbi:MAG TPA: hypothetical protein VGU66_03005 [Candidatus Elarobacter sp.]|nr:hypothetical protein [Candidatus Elarobacter sp.]